MKKSTFQQYSKIKREYEDFKELKENLGLHNSDYANTKEISKKLTQTTNLVKKMNENEDNLLDELKEQLTWLS